MERVDVKMPLKHIVVILYILIVGSVYTEICDVPLNTSSCSDDMSLVYTFSAKENVCVKALWFGCPSDNMFLDISTCELNCNEIWDDNTTPINKNKIQKASSDLQNLLEYSYTDTPKKANNAAKIGTGSDKKIDTPKTEDQSMKKVSIDKEKLKKVDAPKKEPKLEKKISIDPMIDKTGAPKEGATKKFYIHAQTELIRKLRRANRKLDSRTEYEYIDLMLRDEYVTPTGNMLEFE